MKNPTFFLIFVFNFFLVQSQVGIGTTNPDASAILELDSDSQGLLTPRMTTAERNGISSPAHGLLVFDTDEDSFYYYTASNWVELEGADVRDNYKLVKSLADLADELAAGGGSTYLLDTETYYEINGTLILDAPIDLNDAYISGLDANEDVLVRVGATIFTGSNGGSIRNLTLSAPGGSIFGLTGSGAEVLVFQNSVIANSGSVGFISNFGVVFKNIIQLVNNSTGIVYTDIGDLLLGNMAWFDSNAGTYETYVGTFNLIEKTSGFCKVPSGATAIDVSANPTVAQGTILNTPFSGAGTFINGYTVGSYDGFNFDTNWFVNSPGLILETDWVSAGNFFFNGTLTTGFTQTITDGTAVEVQGNGTFTTSGLFRFTSGGGNNRLIYDGIKTRQFNINASLSIRVSNAIGNFYAFVIAKNGVLVTESNSIAYINSDTQIQNISLNANVNLANGDYIEVFVQRLTGAESDTLVVFSENLSIK